MVDTIESGAGVKVEGDKTASISVSPENVNFENGDSLDLEKEGEKTSSKHTEKAGNNIEVEDQSRGESHENANMPKETKQMQSLEIETQDNNTEHSANEANESFEDDMEPLVGDSDKETKKDTFKKHQHLCCLLCVRPQQVGNMKIFLPAVFERTGWGISGPHWFGPICVILLISFASHYFINISEHRIGPITTAICMLFTLASCYNLANVAYRDPGVVSLQPQVERPDMSDEDTRMQYRWCDRCQVFQPVDGAHCSDCNVCVAGFDHHCVWMGTCIGKKNFKQFVLFNITWLLYLIYAITWVSVVGPLIFGHRHKHV